MTSTSSWLLGTHKKELPWEMFQDLQQPHTYLLERPDVMKPFWKEYEKKSLGKKRKEKVLTFFLNTECIWKRLHRFPHFHYFPFSCQWHYYTAWPTFQWDLFTWSPQQSNNIPSFSPLSLHLSLSHWNYLSVNGINENLYAHFINNSSHSDFGKCMEQGIIMHTDEGGWR